MSQEIYEAFQELKGLDEATFSFDKPGILKLQDFLDNSDNTTKTEIIVVDPEAKSESDLSDSYGGEVVLECCTCHGLLSKKPSEVIIDGELQRANVDEECPYCYNTGGYLIVGEFKDNTTEEVKDTEDEEVMTTDTSEQGEVVKESIDTFKSGIIEFPSGDYVYVAVDGDKLVAGSATNTGILHEYEVDLDEDGVTDDKLQELYDKIVSEHPEFEDSVVESYELLSGTVVKCFSDFYRAKKYAENKGLKEAEYGDVYGSPFAYCYWNKSGDRDDDEEVIAYYAFEKGKPRPLTEEEKKYLEKEKEVKFDDSISESVNKSMNQNKKKIKHNKLVEKYFYGVDGVEFIWHGEWADPEVRYNGHTYNYYDLEDSLLSTYREEHPEDKNDTGFDDWVSANPDETYNILYDLVPNDLYEFEGNHYYLDKDNPIYSGDDVIVVEAVRFDKWASEPDEYAVVQDDEIIKVTTDKDEAIDMVKKFDESIKNHMRHGSVRELKEAPIYDLEPTYDSRNSFYNKARVDSKKDSETLYSYNVPVAKVENGKATLYPKWNYSGTTLRHVKEFLRQHGFRADTLKQIERDYPVEEFNESYCNESRISDVAYDVAEDILNSVGDSKDSITWDEFNDYLSKSYKKITGKEYVNDEDFDTDIRVIHTPGHSAGSVCFYSAEDKFLVSGDTLFLESVGRTDFPSGSQAELENSIRNKLYALPGDTMVLPGHGFHTAIKHEKEYNPFVHV